MFSFPGMVAALLSAVANGSWSMLMKLDQVVETHVDPVVFTLYATTGVALSSWAIVPFLDYVEWFNVPGTVAGMFLVLALLFSFVAVRLVGVSIAQGMWGGLAVLVAFVWGAGGPAPVGKPVESWIGSAIALLLLMVGIVGVAFCKDIATLVQRGKAESESLLEEEQPPENRTSDLFRYFGYLCAVLVGFFGGSILVPASFVPKEIAGFGFLPSFGTGCAFSTLFIGALYCRLRHADPITGNGAAILPGVLAGCIWNAGNYLQIFAQAYYDLSYGVAYPILQCALFVSGMWGIFLFKELEKPVAIEVFFVSGGILVVGVITLSVFGPQ